MTDTPHHYQDDPCCLFVGSSRYQLIEDGPQVWHDFYICPSKPINMIVRYGEMGEYSSNLVFFPHSEKMQQGYELAMASSLDDELKYRLTEYIKYVLIGAIEERTTSLHRLEVSQIASVFRLIQSSLYPKD